MTRLLIGLSCLALLLAGCAGLNRKPAVEPATVPPEVRGATWPQAPVRYCVVEGEGDGFVSQQVLVSLAQEAMSRWGVQTRFEGECPGPLATDNGRNEIAWGTLGRDGPHSLDKAGNTNIRYVQTPEDVIPRITEADIVLDGSPPAGKESRDCLFTTLLHETGHFFGVQHLGRGAVMSPVITECLQQLTPDDRRALDALY